MIPDKIFKKLIHSYSGYTMFSNGTEIEKGYKPDYALKKKDDYIILESENSSSRKTFVGGMVKAAHFLQKEKTGTLIFVIVPKNNTKASSIASHLAPYFQWLKNKTNLKEVFVIEAGKYWINQTAIAIDKNEFKVSAIKVTA